MAEVSKTAKKSQQKSTKQLGKKCPGCGEAMVATKVMACKLPFGTHTTGQLQRDIGKGMYWICGKCGYCERVHKK
jgi:ribosomal protein S27AE